MAQIVIFYLSYSRCEFSSECSRASISFFFAPHLKRTHPRSLESLKKRMLRGENGQFLSATPRLK